MRENEISKVIVDSAVEVHRTLGGPGLLESVYEQALAWEISQRGCVVECQKVIPLVYKGQTLSLPLRLDMLVNGLVIVECKATTEYNSIYEIQTRTYLRITGLKLGMVINFGEQYVINGVHRVPNGLDDEPLKAYIARQKNRKAY